MKRKMTCNNVASAADIARRQKHISSGMKKYAKNLFLQANVSTSMEQVVLAMAPLHPLAIE